MAEIQVSESSIDEENLNDESQNSIIREQNAESQSSNSLMMNSSIPQEFSNDKSASLNITSLHSFIY